MSCHHSQKTINRHHDQVNAGRIRKQQRQEDRHQRYLAIRDEATITNQLVTAFAFICFAYTAIASAVYLGYLI